MDYLANRTNALGLKSPVREVLLRVCPVSQKRHCFGIKNLYRLPFKSAASSKGILHLFALSSPPGNVSLLACPGKSRDTSDRAEAWGIGSYGGSSVQQ